MGLAAEMRKRPSLAPIRNIALSRLDSAFFHARRRSFRSAEFIFGGDPLREAKFSMVRASGRNGRMPSNGQDGTRRLLNKGTARYEIQAPPCWAVSLAIPAGESTNGECRGYDSGRKGNFVPFFPLFFDAIGCVIGCMGTKRSVREA